MDGGGGEVVISDDQEDLIGGHLSKALKMRRQQALLIQYFRQKSISGEKGVRGM